MSHTPKQWLIAARPWSFVVSAMPVIVTTSLLYFLQYPIHWTRALLALVGILFFHAAGNLLSDYYDYLKGIDADDTTGAKTLTSGEFQPIEIRAYGVVMLLCGSLVGLLLVWLTGSWALLAVGLAGALVTVLYTFMKSHALGDLNVLLTFGILPALGTSIAATGSLQWSSLWAVLAIVPITICVLHTNNTHDVPTDARAGILTLPMLIGRQASIWLYCIFDALPIVWVTLCVMLGQMPWAALLIWLSAGIVMRNCRTMLSFSHDAHAIDVLDQATAQQQLVSGGLLTVGILGFTLISHLL